MIDSKNPAGESGSFNPFALAVAAIAICAALVVMGATALAPASATDSTTPYAGPTGYFPDQFVNQAKEIEPMPEMYY